MPYTPPASVIAGLIALQVVYVLCITYRDRFAGSAPVPRSKQIAWDTRATCRLDTFTLQDAFIHNYGSHDDLLAAHGIELGSIAAQVGVT